VNTVLCACGRHVEVPWRKTGRAKHPLADLAPGEALWLPVHPKTLSGSVIYWQRKLGAVFRRRKATRDGVHGCEVRRLAAAPLSGAPGGEGSDATAARGAQRGSQVPCARDLP
jgi:hypothetical protein